MTNTKGMTMPQIDDAELFGNAEDQRVFISQMSIGEPDQRESRHLEGSENKRSKRHFKESLIMRISNR